MKKRALVAMLVSAAMACTLFVGCSTPTKKHRSDSGSKTESSDSKSSSSSERASATVVDTDKLPIKGVGAEGFNGCKGGQGIQDRIHFQEHNQSLYDSTG